MSDDQLWTARELSKFLGYSETTVARLVSQEPQKLPPRVEGLSRPRWLPSAVLEWAKGNTSTSGQVRRGRPRINGV